LGRLFGERIYKKEVAQRLKEVQVEIPIDVSFESYRKRYYLDMLISGCYCSGIQTRDNVR
jgi:hypothetical protein